MAQDQDLRSRDRVPAGARADAGFHRRAGGGRSRRHARCHEEARRRSEEDQPAGAGRSRHRPLGRGQLLRQQRPRSRRTSRKSTSRTRSATSSSNGRSARSRISAWCRPAPASAIRSISNICRRPSGPRKEQGQGRRQGDDDRDRLSGHAGRHRLAHHHGQRALGARLGRRRHRGGGRDARPALFDGAARSDRRSSSPASSRKASPRPISCSP